MISLSVADESDVVKNWKTKYKRVNHRYPVYEDLSHNGIIRIAIKQDLLKNQRGICGYCGRPIKLDSSHIEHIKPQSNSQYRKLTLDYGNMLASCITKKPREHCGQSKKDKYSDDFISPYEENCEQFFEYGNSSGKVYATGDNMRANYTIELLKLNEKSLCAARREAYWTSGIQSMTKEELNELVRNIRDGSGEIPFRGMLLSLAEERLQND